MLLFSLLANGQVNDSLLFNKVQNLLSLAGNPISTSEIDIINHKAMRLGISCNERITSWSYHILLPEAIVGSEPRTNNFRNDTMVHCTIGTSEDYSLTVVVDGKKKKQNLGYDRGHLAPSADFKWSKKAISESFYYSNMAPQVPELNRQSWANLEESIRKSISFDTLVYFVVTGPILENHTSFTGGPNQIPVPNYFFKAIISLGEHPKGIAFIMPNGKCELPLSSYVVTIDELEKRTNLDLFPNIDKKTQSQIESTSVYSNWKF